LYLVGSSLPPEPVSLPPQLAQIDLSAVKQSINLYSADVPLSNKQAYNNQIHKVL